MHVHSVLEQPTQTNPCSLTLKSLTLHFSTKSARSEGSSTIFRGILVVKSLPGASWGSPSSVKFAKRTALVKLISYLEKTSVSKYYIKYWYYLNELTFFKHVNQGNIWKQRLIKINHAEFLKNLFDIPKKIKLKLISV